MRRRWAAVSEDDKEAVAGLCRGQPCEITVSLGDNGNVRALEPVYTSCICTMRALLRFVTDEV